MSATLHATTMKAALVFAACLLLAVAAEAQAESLKWRQAYQIIKSESIEVGDTPGHVVGAGEGRGLAFFENGDIAVFSGKFTVDYTGGNGPHQAYFLYTFEDGSTLVLKVLGAATVEQGGKVSSFKGETAVVHGTGRFTGSKGSGSYTGKRVTPLASGAQAYMDHVLTYTPASR